MKKWVKVLLIMFSIFLIAILYFLLGTDNPFNENIKSRLIQNKEVNQIGKIEVIDTIKLDQLILENPNTIFHVFTYYCGPCKNSLKSGSEFDSTHHKKIIYVSVDNYTTLDKINKLVNQNNNISKIYSIDDNQVKGIHWKRGEFLLNKYYPIYDKNMVGYPFDLYSNDSSKFTNITLGYKEK